MKLWKPSKKCVLLTLLVLVLGGVCWYYVANFCGPYNKSMGYLEDMAEALEKGDTAEVFRLNAEYTDWMAGLSTEDSVEAERARYDFVRQNPTEQSESTAPVVEESAECGEEEDWAAMMEAAGMSTEEAESGDSITLF